MKPILAFLLLCGATFAQCGPGGCPPAWSPAPQQWCPPQPQWQPQPSVGFGGDIGGFGLGIRAGFDNTPIKASHPRGCAIRIGDSGGYFSGVIVSADGLILTAKHCLMNGGAVYPVIDGKKFQSRVLYEAPETEGPVVLKIEATGLPAASIAELVPKVGDQAYCVGYPNNQPTAVQISGRMQMPEWSYREGYNVIPSSPSTPGAWRSSVLNAPAQGGMSGGPLFNANGEVIGLLSATGPFASRYIGIAAIRVAMQAASTSEDWQDAPAPISGGPAPLWERTPEATPTPILEPLPKPIAEQPKPVTSAELAEFAAQLKPEPIDYSKIGAAVAENQVLGQKEVVKEVGRLGSIVEKLSVAVKAINVVAPAVGLELPWWLGAAATTGPVGIGVGAAFFGIKALLKWRASRKEKPSLPIGVAATEKVLVPIAVENPPAKGVVIPDVRFTEIETDRYAQAHAWAQDQLARKYPNSVSTMEAENALIKQYLGGLGVGAA